MVVTLPEELVGSVYQQVLLRQTQIQQLSLLYNGHYPTPKCLVAYGPEDTNKVETVQHALQQNEIDHVVINCKDCLTQRHLLTKIFAQCFQHLGKQDQLGRYDRLDSINALGSNLKKLLQTREEKLIIVLNGADQQRGATPTLLPAVARLGDIIPSLSIILTSSSARPLVLHSCGIPYIAFPPYKRNEAIQILLRHPPTLLPDPLPPFAQNLKKESVDLIYKQFATVVYDTLIAPTTNSIQKYRVAVQTLWPRFIWPAIIGERLNGKNTDWDFARLLSKNRALFREEGEEALLHRLIREPNQPQTFEELQEQKEQLDVNPQPASQTPNKQATTLFRPVQQPSQLQVDSHPKTPPLLKYLPTLLLLAAYLASHTHPKHDIVLFSRLSTASSTNRRKKKYLARSRAGGISKTPTKSPSKKSTLSNTDGVNGDINDPETPSKRKNKQVNMEIATATASTPKKERADRSMRAIFEKTSNIARPFSLERLVAILRAIHPDGIKSGRGVADRCYAELGELERLRLVVRVGDRRDDGGGGVMEEKWRCVVGREWVVEAGRAWGVGIEGWEFE